MYYNRYHIINLNSSIIKLIFPIAYFLLDEKSLTLKTPISKKYGTPNRVVFQKGIQI